jgi:hypothetical protein
MSSKKPWKSVLHNLGYKKTKPHPYYVQNRQYVRTATSSNARNKVNHGATPVSVAMKAIDVEYNQLMWGYEKHRKTYYNITPKQYILKMTGHSGQIFVRYRLNSFIKYAMRGVFDRLCELFIGMKSFHKKLYVARIKNETRTKIKDINRQIDNHVLQITQPCIFIRGSIRKYHEFISLPYQKYDGIAKTILEQMKRYMQRRYELDIIRGPIDTPQKIKILTSFRTYPYTGTKLSDIITSAYKSRNSNEKYEKRIGKSNTHVIYGTAKTQQTKNDRGKDSTTFYKMKPTVRR